MNKSILVTFMNRNFQIYQTQQITNNGDGTGQKHSIHYAPAQARIQR